MAEKKEKSNHKHWFESHKIAGYSPQDWSVKLSIFLIVVITIPLLFPSGRSLNYTDFIPWTIVNKKVIAPFRFPVLKSQD